MDFLTIFFFNWCIFWPQKFIPSYSRRICNHDIPHKQRTFCWFSRKISAKFLHFYPTQLTGTHSQLTLRNVPTFNLTRYSGLQSIWQPVQGTLYTSPNKSPYCTSDPFLAVYVSYSPILWFIHKVIEYFGLIFLYKEASLFFSDHGVDT